MSEQNNEGLSRRNFLANAAVFTAGALVAGGALGGVKSGRAEAAYTPMPWPYAILDIEAVRRKAYENYFIGGCMYATTSSLLTNLIQTVGAPWDSLPMDMFKYGSGGAYGWGTTCGAPNGAAYIIQLCAGTSTDTMINELMGWYCNNPFPSTLMDSYANFRRQKQTVSDSPLCHQSASIWSNTAKKAINSAERKDRCAKVAGDTAAKAAEFLNKWKAGTFTAVWAPSAETQACMSCHVGVTSTYDNAQAKAMCTPCHDDKASNHY